MNAEPTEQSSESPQKKHTCETKFAFLMFAALKE